VTEGTVGDAGPVLTDPQRGRLSAILGELREALGEARTLLAHDASLAPGTRDEASQLTEQLRDQVAAALVALDLAPRAIPVNRRIRSLLLAQRIRLLDAHAEKLSGYGRVDPRLAAQLNPKIDSLLSTLAALHEVVASGSEDGAFA
jgi:hypothetical protein